MAFNKLSLREKLFTKTRQEGDCLVWIGQKDPRGYGKLKLAGRQQRAHRLMFELIKGPMPAGMVVLHSCDNTSCVNPAHLSAGTQADNVADMCAKGRRASTKGENNPRARLTQKQVDEIRARFVRYDRRNGARQISREYGVSKTVIQDIVTDRIWREAGEKSTY